MHSIYIIHNTQTDRVYVGQTRKETSRLRQHRYMLSAGKHHCEPLQKGWNTHGHTAFDFFFVITGLTQEEADEIEQLYVKWYRGIGLSYNCDGGGKGSRDPSPEMRKKMSESHMGQSRPCAPETRQKMSESISRAWTPERKAAFAESRKNNQFNLGRKHSDEIRRKMSDVKKGEANPMFGKPASEAQKQAASARWKGAKRSPFTDGHKQKLREAAIAQKRKPMSEETKEKIRQKKLERDAAARE